ncbi:beta-lactamase/transpeptidase-like protein [Nemania sp. FL0031]|nr:beta-lactamase/transpeptidase-like protein [Nemania sp. FL0031]
MVTDITNWRDEGHNIWGFQNADKILKTTPIYSGHKSTELKSKAFESGSFKLQLPDDTSLDLPTFLSQTETDGIVIIKDGVIFYEDYGRTNAQSSIHTTFSVSKSITGLLCGVLVEQGKLKPEDLVSSHVPEVKGSAYENVTIRQLLDMRSGVKHGDETPGYHDALGLYPVDSDKAHTNLHDYIRTIQSSPSPPINGLDGPPYDYISSNIDLLGWVIERASGKKLPEVLSESLWQPMGAESPGHFITDRSGNAAASAGICATTRDIARVGQAILQGIVPKSWVQDILQNGSQPAFAAGPEKIEFDPVFKSAAYRSCWFVDQDSQVMMASGIHGQLLLIDHKNGVVMAKTSSQPKRTTWEKIRLTIRAFWEFTRIVNSQC